MPACLEQYDEGNDKSNDFCLSGMTMATCSVFLGRGGWGWGWCGWGFVWWNLCWNMLEDGLGGSQIMYVMNRYLWKTGDDGHLSKQGVQACDMSVCLEAGEKSEDSHSHHHHGW